MVESLNMMMKAVGKRVGVVLVLLAVSARATAQTGSTPSAPLTRVSMADAVRLTLEHNHQLRGQQLNVEASKADEITAALKPNPVVTSTNASFPVFSPSQLTFSNMANNQSYVESLGYLFERGGKRAKRTLVAQDTTDVAAKTAVDAERQLTFQTRQAFVNVLLAQSSLDLARDNLKDFSNVLEVNRQRVTAGDLAEADFLKISLQNLQFEQDVSSAEAALVQAKAALRQSIGMEGVTEDFDVDGSLAFVKHDVTLDNLKTAALAARPDLLAAQSGQRLAQDTQALAYAQRTRDVTGEVEYDRAGDMNGLGFGFSIELPFHDRNQGNIAHSIVGVRQATEAEALVRTAVLTDVVTAYAAFKANEKVISLYQSGYLDQAQQSLDVTTYVYQQGNGTLLDLLDATRTYRATQLAFRQALAAYMNSVEQINFAVGRQVIQ